MLFNNKLLLGIAKAIKTITIFKVVNNENYFKEFFFN